MHPPGSVIQKGQHSTGGETSRLPRTCRRVGQACQPNRKEPVWDFKGEMGLFARCTLYAAIVLPLQAAPNFTINLRSDAAVELYVEYGTATGVYGTQTKSLTAAADPNVSGFFLAQVVLTGLRADTQYYYRMQYRAAGSTGAFTPGTESSFHTQRAPG